VVNLFTNPISLVHWNIDAVASRMYLPSACLADAIRATGSFSLLLCSGIGKKFAHVMPDNSPVLLLVVSGLPLPLLEAALTGDPFGERFSFPEFVQ
jgi:hypothetical protein